MVNSTRRSSEFEDEAGNPGSLGAALRKRRKHYAGFEKRCSTSVVEEESCGEKCEFEGAKGWYQSCVFSIDS